MKIFVKNEHELKKIREFAIRYRNYNYKEVMNEHAIICDIEINMSIAELCELVKFVKEGDDDQ